tara:strand:- start:2669 stop:3085 length:417 start_codon:yes stop_codon:yes gene_type:complete
MKVTGFDGREHALTFKRFRGNSGRDNKSSHHIRARELLSELFPYQRIYEEVTLPGSKTISTGLLYADFLIPNKYIIVEVHGKQHYEYCSHFHKTKADFMKSRKRDKKKIEWCELNDFTIIVLPYNKEDQWKNLIIDSL